MSAYCGNCDRDCDCLTVCEQQERERPGADPHSDEERAPQDRGCRYCQAHPGEWCEYDCGSPNASIHPDYQPRERVARWLRALACEAPEDVWEHVDPGPREHWRAKADELLSLLGDA